MGQRGDSEQDAQGLLGHRKDLTGSQTSDVICLRFYQDFLTFQLLCYRLWGAGPQAGRTGAGGVPHMWHVA